MISWLIIIILAYFFFSLAYLGDKFILSGRPKPISYTFYVGLISIFVVFLIPFSTFKLPDWHTIIWIIAEAIVYIAGLYTMFLAIKKFEVSKVMTTIGASQPLFIFAFTWLAFGPQLMSIQNFLAFVLLIIGGVFISLEKNVKYMGSYLIITIISSLFFSLDYIFSKLVFLSLPFLEGFICMRICVFLFSLLFLLSKQNRKEIFTKQNLEKKNTGPIFIAGHVAGGIANILQGLAVSLAPIALLPIVNSLRGIQYVFLFLMTLFLSIFFPHILKEETSPSVIVQKIIAILLIVVGLALLVI